MMMDKQEETPATTRWILEKEHEFRFEVEHGVYSTIQVCSRREKR